MLRICDLVPCSFNPRFPALDQERVAHLAASIQQHGLLHPVLLRKVEHHHQIVAGNYRAAALRQLYGDDFVLLASQYHVRQLTDEEASYASLIENLDRNDLSEMELAKCVVFWRDRFGKKQKELAELFGRSQPWVSQMIALVEDEERMPALVRDALGGNGDYQTSDTPERMPSRSNGFTISKHHWLELRKLDDEKLREHLAQKIKRRELSVAQTRELVHKTICSIKRKPRVCSAFDPQLTTLWDFSTCDVRFGVDYPGRLPGQVVQNLVHFYSQEGDLVVDPMAGGGTKLDVCRVMKRACHAYDLAPVREDIVQHDVLDGIPEADESVQLVVLDPPYWRTKRGDYAEGASQLASLDLRAFYDAMEYVARECLRVLRPGGVVALVIGNWMEKNTRFVDLAFGCAKLFGAHLNPVARVCLTNRNYAGISFANTIDAKKRGYMLNGFRDVLVFRKSAVANV
jgi:ParB/RepB/Spo0J family partition protein